MMGSHKKTAQTNKLVATGGLCNQRPVSAGLVGTMVKTLAYQSNGSEFESWCRLATPLSTGDLSPLGSDPDDFCGSRNGR